MSKTTNNSTMPLSNRFVIALVTAPDLKVARKLAQTILKARLVACANLLPKIESHYWWQGKLEKSAEVLILLKTTKANVGKLEQCVLGNHPYDTPEFIVLSATSGSKRYFDWITESVR